MIGPLAPASSVRSRSKNTALRPVARATPDPVGFLAADFLVPDFLVPDFLALEPSVEDFLALAGPFVSCLAIGEP